MATDALINQSLYKGNCIMLTTKHAKSIAISLPFYETLGANIIEYVVDTDKLGTFSGEVEREGNILECARKKCEWALNKLGNNVEFALASEGSFIPHPSNPFLVCDYEILYFIDSYREFHLYMSQISDKTNYRKQEVKSLEDIQKFTEQVMFPSHAIILRAQNKETKSPIFKGLDKLEAIEEAFKSCLKYAENGKIWVETDMRAQFNPSRMRVIGELATKFSERLRTLCPSCNNPGWGKVREEKGLLCICCGSETKLVKSEVFGCVKCDYKKNIERSDGKKTADPGNCQYCNP